MCWVNKLCYNQLNQLLCAASSAVIPTMGVVTDMESIDYVVLVVVPVIAVIITVAVVVPIVITFLYFLWSKKSKICLNGT